MAGQLFLTAHKMWVVLVWALCGLISSLGKHAEASDQAEKTFQDLLGERRRLREGFRPQTLCAGSVTIKDAKGKEYVVNSTELNVNIKPSSIELLGETKNTLSIQYSQARKNCHKRRRLGLWYLDHELCLAIKQVNSSNLKKYN